MNQNTHWNTAGRASVLACDTRLERAQASDKLRERGFTRLYYFETVSGQFCVEGLGEGEQRIDIDELEGAL